MNPLTKAIDNLLNNNHRLLIKREHTSVRITAVSNNTNESISALVSKEGIDRLAIIIDDLNFAIQRKEEK